jgi:hypothetical protein
MGKSNVRVPGQEKVTVYTCVIGGYDLILQPARQQKEITFTIFSDVPVRFRSWAQRPIERVFDNDIYTNRYHKFFPHRLFKESDYSVYIDGNISIIGDIAPLLDEFAATGAAMGVFRHRERFNVAEELAACIEQRRFDQKDLLMYESQLEHMFSEGMPPGQRLTDNGIIFRWHKHPGLEQAMSDWWDEINYYTKRDQLSLPFVIWKNQLPVWVWDWSFRAPNPFFEKYPHRGSPLRDVRIRFRNFLSRSRNILPFNR